MIGKILLSAGWFFGALLQAGPPRTWRIPTRWARAGDPQAPMVRFEGVPFSWKEGLPPGAGRQVRSLAPPRFAVLRLLGLNRRALLVRLGRALPGRAGTPPDFPDTLLLDLQGDGRFGREERFPLRWEGAGGLGRARTEEIRLGGRPFEIQVRPGGGGWKGFLFPHAWRVGWGPGPRRKWFFLYLDRDLDGRVGPRDLWLLAGPGDQRREARVLGPEELREGTAPFPLGGDRAARLERIDPGGNAVIRISPGGRKAEAEYLARRARAVRARWSRIFAVDDQDRRRRLGIPRETPLGGVEIPWIHTTDPRPLCGKARPGRPVLFWLDLEDSTECRRLEHYTLGARQAARWIARRFLAVHVPLGLCPKDPGEAWGVVSAPALVVVGASGKVLWKREGFLTPAELLAALKGPARGAAPAGKAE